MHPVLFRLPLGSLGVIPIYTWGVMLGLSLIVGWYLSLGLAERDRLPREMLANCYVITALSALLFARLLFVLTNPESFEGWASMFEMRSGGMVAYGGFLGGVLASLVYLRLKDFPLLPWADVAVPSLAAGIFLTRIGCYLYGCDFGERLSASAPAALQRVGTFPHWAEGTLEQGVGSPAWRHHVTMEWVDADAMQSLPVHPTQLYEAAVGAALVGLLLWLRKRQSFRGQLFFVFTFLYGLARFLLELVRDDVERGSVPPHLAPHVLLPACLGLFALAFIAFVTPTFRNGPVRTVVSVLAFAPAVLAYLSFAPGAFAAQTTSSLSTSQFIALTSSVLVCWAYGVMWRGAKANPRAAMAPIAWHDEDDLDPPAAAEATESPSSDSEEQGETNDQSASGKGKKKRKAATT